MKEADLESETENGVTMDQPIRVLIADDHLSSRDGLKGLLATKLGITIVGEATDGQQAVQLVKQRHPDVVLMDIRMPVMDGLEATRIIKDHWPEVKVVILTMYPSHQAEALAVGADAFLVKGCASDLLLQAIS